MADSTTQQGCMAEGIYVLYGQVEQGMVSKQYKKE